MISEFLISILIAALCGALIGAERQLTGHVAGVQTNVLMCIGTCIFMQIPYIIFSEDYIRMSAAIIQGIGFLCASVIFKEAGVVKGINTSVALLCSAGVGIICATGNWNIAIAISLIVVFINFCTRYLSLLIKPQTALSFNNSFYLLELVCEDSIHKEITETIRNLEKKNSISLISTEIIHLENGNVEFKVRFKVYGKKCGELIKEKIDMFNSNNKVKSLSYKIL